MPKSSKPRKKYRPKTGLILDTVSWVIKMPPIPDALRNPKDDKNDNHILYKAA